jgi:ribokinase
LASYMRDLVMTIDRFPTPGETRTGLDFTEGSGGKGSNQAVQAARCGASVSVIAALGADEGAAKARRLWNAEGFAASHVAELPSAATGVALILVDKNGENQIAIAPGANQLIPTALIEEARPALAASALVMAQLEVPVAAIIQAFSIGRSGGAVTVLNAAPALPDLPKEIWPLVDILVVNEAEAATLVGEAHPDLSSPDLASALCEWVSRAVVITLGAEGALVLRKNGKEPVLHPAQPVKVVDTTGAGDAFIGAFAARYVDTWDLDEAVSWGVAAGSLACTGLGALAPTVTRDAVADYVSEKPLVRSA